MSIQLVYHTFEIIGIVSCLLICGGVLKSDAKNRSSQLLALLAVCCISFFVRTRQEYNYYIPEVLQLPSTFLDIPLDLLMNASSGIFMLLAHSLLRENKPFPRWLLAMFCFQLLLEPVSLFWTKDILLGWGATLGVAFVEFTFYTLPRALQLVFVACALYWTVSDWRGDLVERRRTIRWVLLVYQGVGNLAATLAYGFVVPQVNYFAFEAHVVTVIVSSLAPFLLVLVNFKFDLSVETAPKTERLKETISETSEDWQHFKHRFQEEHLYRKAGLDIKTLANQFSLPEYRLRKLIHENLGYRNFNAFLHDYRVREACTQLEDPDQASLPILTIALSAGYQSINPFNRAFRELKGMTPTEYRKQASTTKKSHRLVK